MKQRIGSIAVRLFVLGFMLCSRLVPSIARVFINMAGVSRKTFAFCLLIVLLMSTLGVDLVYGQASSFSVRGNVTEADGTAVGEGYTVKAVNQRVSGWSIYTDGKTRANGSYTDITFIDFFGKTTNVGDQIVLTVSENATGQTKGRKVYTVTQQMVTDTVSYTHLRAHET